MDTADIILRAALVGIGGTIVLDLYAFLMQRMFGVPTNWKMVGRWLGHMSKCEFVQTAWDCRAADPRPCAARPALFRDDAGHGYGNGWIADAQAQCDPAEERDRPLHVRHRHVSDRQAYGSCWLITAGREQPSYARLTNVRCCSIVQKRLLD
jgi:Protein of unknown function (DUF2938)